MCSFGLRLKGEGGGNTSFEGLQSGVRLHGTHYLQRKAEGRVSAGFKAWVPCGPYQAFHASSLVPWKPGAPGSHMNHTQNSLKRGYVGEYIGEYDRGYEGGYYFEKKATAHNVRSYTVTNLLTASP